MTRVRAAKRTALTRVAHAVHRIAYRIWLVFLSARLALLVALLAVLALDAIITRAHAAPSDGNAAKRQATIMAVLNEDDLVVVRGIRGGCATGQQPQRVASGRAAGLDIMPEAVDYCVAALTRLGRERQLGYVRDPSHNSLTPALAFDQGFVGAFLKGEGLTPDLPSMEALKPVTERCLAQTEPRTDVCSAAGYVFGVRAYNGENVSAD